MIQLQYDGLRYVVDEMEIQATSVTTDKALLGLLAKRLSIPPYVLQGYVILRGRGGDIRVHPPAA